MDIDALHIFSVDISGDVVTFFDDETPQTGLAGQCGKGGVEKSRPNEQIVVFHKLFILTDIFDFREKAKSAANACEQRFYPFEFSIRCFEDDSPEVEIAFGKVIEPSFYAFFAEKQKEGAVIICYDEQAEHLPADRVITIGKKDDLEAQGHRLFAALRECNSLEGKCVYANLPSTDGFGLALYNRLIRAAAHTVVYPDEL